MVLFVELKMPKNDPKTQENIVKAKQRWLMKIMNRNKVAEANLERWNNMSAQQKLNDLDDRLGKGKGAKKQREKLKKEYDKNSKLSN